MAGNYDTITNRPTDKQRQEAESTGVGGYGGEDSEQKEIRQQTLPSGE